MQHQVVSHEDWLEARTALLAKEKAHMGAGDALAAERRALPWVRIDKPYVFETPTGPASLSDLFAGRSQLFVKHFMLGPGQAQPCVGCSFEADHVDGILPHLQNHDLSYVAVSRAPIAEIEAVKARMGWRFPWVSSLGGDFNYDFGVSFTPEQLAAGPVTYNYREIKLGMTEQSGESVFYKDEAGAIFHTYSAYSRGGEQFLGAYGFLDVTPNGRAETGPYHNLGDWVRLRDTYGQGWSVDAGGRSSPPSDCGCTD